jgi:plasmid stabilization system protein ParE
MIEYVFTPQAEDDLFSIWSYIAQDHVEAADSVEDEIYAACGFLVSYPLAGHVRKDLTALPVRFWTIPRYGNYMIAYDPDSRPLRIIRILHRALDIPHRLKTL